MIIDRNVALVFSGGGARGAYQVGVWKALKELGFVDQIGAVYGTSVGAINGAAFIQNDLDRAIHIWSKLHYNSVFEELPETERILSTENITWIRKTIRQRGLNVQPLKDMLHDNIDETAIRQRGLDFGFVVFDLTKRRPQYLRAEHIEHGKLIDYVIASATFPLFQAHRIDNYRFTDGGVYDNRPIILAENNPNISKVICIDVTIARHFWKNKRTKREIEVDYIRPSRLLGSPLAFNREKIQRNMELGYQDGLVQLPKII